MSRSSPGSRDWSESSLLGLLRSVRWLKVFLETSAVGLLAFAALLAAALVAIFAD